MDTGKNVNVAVDAYVKTQARTKMYEYLSQLGKSVLYRERLGYLHSECG